VCKDLEAFLTLQRLNPRWAPGRRILLKATPVPRPRDLRRQAIELKTRNPTPRVASVFTFHLLLFTFHFSRLRTGWLCAACYDVAKG
jgi:hypothetical protein